MGCRSLALCHERMQRPEAITEDHIIPILSAPYGHYGDNLNIVLIVYCCHLTALYLMYSSFQGLAEEMSPSLLVIYAKSSIFIID